MTIRTIRCLLFCCLLAWSSHATAQTNAFSHIQFTRYAACVTSVAEPAAVQFSTDAVGITDWWWTFGNGQQSFDANPVTEYSLPGSYTVTLTVETEQDNQLSLVEENLIQVNELLFEDDFGNPGFSDLHWQHFDASMIVDSALEFDLQVAASTRGEQNGQIICLNGGGEQPSVPMPNGRFFFDLELIAEDLRPVKYTAFRLLDGSEQPLAGLRVKGRRGFFEVRIEGPGGASDWHPLVQPNPMLSIGLDWYRDGVSGGLSVEIKEGVQPPVTQHLVLLGQPDFRFLQLGVIALDWSDEETRAGRMRIDNFSTCTFDHRPDLF